tara:strand:- start:158 stop:1132 length:975 start_codon:yes stop_codon:yes gene_type:complete
MIEGIKKRNLRKKRSIYNYKWKLFSFFCVFFSIQTFCQDSIPIAKDLAEENDLNFQQFFFKALSEKAIGNYQKAIENLENCNQILTKDAAVYFEFSKNYFYLNNMLVAEEYIDRALLIQPTNIWMLKHLVKIFLKEKNFSEAILIQKKIVSLNSNERVPLLEMYIQNKEDQNAISLMSIIEQENFLSARYKKIKHNFEQRKEPPVSLDKTLPTNSLESQFATNKSFSLLKKILEKNKENPLLLIKYSDEGILLFPAQPFVYLMQGKALNDQREYERALLCLKNGVDFVIADDMEIAFYKEIAISYRGLGNFKEENKYIDKSKKR